MRILVAEDERVTRASLVRQLTAWGHTVSAAADGEEAWGLFGAGEFDMVITDWEMPSVSGVELIERIRRQARAGYVYIIMLTGRSDKADIVRGIEAGADDFVSKPFDREELRVRLLAGERVVRLERALNDQNAALRAASERLHHDLRAAARVQRSMLPRGEIETARVRTAWKYIPTEELCGDAVGLFMVAERHLVAYVLDVSGHGVPAALLSVTAMHSLSPSADAAAFAAGTGDGAGGGAATSSPRTVVSDLNRRFASTDNDGRYMTMVLCVLDTHTGVLTFARAGHPPPLVVRQGRSLAVPDDGGMPVGLYDEAEFVDAQVQLHKGDRVVLLSDGVIEQLDPPQRVQFGTEKVESLFVGHAGEAGHQVIDRTIEALTAWAGTRSFADDVSLMCIDWLG